MIPMRDIQRYCDGIAAAFQPRKVILFGSYAYGKPTADSDVDLVVVRPRKGRARRSAPSTAWPAFNHTLCGVRTWSEEHLFSSAQYLLSHLVESIIHSII